MSTSPTPALPPQHALAERSTEASTLASLWSTWSALRDAAPRPEDFTSRARELAQRFVAHRDALFRANAVLQADDPHDHDPHTPSQTEANQHAIKVCTTALSELTAALGLSSER